MWGSVSLLRQKIISKSRTTTVMLRTRLFSGGCGFIEVLNKIQAICTVIYGTMSNNKKYYTMDKIRLSYFRRSFLVTLDIDESSVMQLAEMGFPLEACRKAVYYTGNLGAEVAFNWIIAHMEEPGQ